MFPSIYTQSNGLYMGVNRMVISVLSALSFGPLNINDVTDEFKRIMKHSDPKIISNYIISAYDLQTLDERQCA